MSAAHTPGPWKLKLGKGIQYTYLVADKKGQDIANWAHYPNATKAQTKANARLIASAPELLDALQGFIEGAESMGWCTEKARAAIAKATGEAA